MSIATTAREESKRIAFTDACKPWAKNGLHSWFARGWEDRDNGRPWSVFMGGRPEGDAYRAGRDDYDQWLSSDLGWGQVEA